MRAMAAAIPAGVPRLRTARPDVRATAGVALLAVLFGSLAGTPALYRLLIATALLAALAMTATRWPRGAVVATLAFLPLLAFLRRVLMPLADWTSRDPLLLVGPGLAAFLVVWLFALGGRPIAGTRWFGPLPALVAAFLALVCVQAANPRTGGPLVGLGGLVFTAVPLVWLFIGREVADRTLVRRLIVGVAAFGAVVGAYGLYQTQVGLPSWDRAWLEVSGYFALNVGGVTRAFGTFSSSAEYVLWVGAAVTCSLALALHGRRAWLLALPLLLVALFLGSGRGALILTVLAAVAQVALRTLRPRAAVVAAVAAVVVLALGVRVLMPALSPTGALAANPLASHQVSGLASPLDSRQSTLGLHFELFRDGVRRGFVDPLGQGTGATTIASPTLGNDPGNPRTGNGVGRATEIDVSDAFVSQGLAGGLLYGTIVVLVLLGVVRLYALRRDPVVLAVFGILVVTLGQWGTGGHYALAPLTWFLIGWTIAESRRGDRPVPG